MNINPKTTKPLSRRGTEMSSKPVGWSKHGKAYLDHVKMNESAWSFSVTAKLNDVSIFRLDPFGGWLLSVYYHTIARKWKAHNCNPCDLSPFKTIYECKREIKGQLNHPIGSTRNLYVHRSNHLECMETKWKNITICFFCFPVSLPLLGFVVLEQYFGRYINAS